MPDFPGGCSSFRQRLFCLHFYRKSAGRRNLPLCRATGGADGHCRRSRRHPRMAPDPAGDGAEAGPLTSATPALPGRSPKPRISYSIEYATTRLNPRIERLCDLVSPRVCASSLTKATRCGCRLCTRRERLEGTQSPIKNSGTPLTHSAQLRAGEAEGSSIVNLKQAHTRTPPGGMMQKSQVETPWTVH